jgi:hypothetical protein
VLIPDYQVRSVEHRVAGDVVEYRCACGREAVMETMPSGHAWHMSEGLHIAA